MHIFAIAYQWVIICKKDYSISYIYNIDSVFDKIISTFMPRVAHLTIDHYLLIMHNVFIMILFKTF